MVFLSFDFALFIVHDNHAFVLLVVVSYICLVDKHPWTYSPIKSTSRTDGEVVVS